MSDPINVQQIVMEYVTVSAVVSVINTKLIKPRFPRVGAVISTICALNPADLGKVIDDIASLFPTGSATMAAKRLKANKDLEKIGDR